jgi:hypothetical protein
MGDIVTGADGEIALSVEIAAASPIHTIEIRRGTELIETIRPGEGLPTGRRYIAVWQGAEYRGRFRQSTWDGQLRIEGNTIEAIRPVNFFNPDEQPRLVDPRTVAWRSITTGNFVGVAFTLAERNTGRARIETANGTLDCVLADLGAEPAVLDCGKLDRRLSIARLCDANPHRSVALSRSIPLRAGTDNPIYVAVTLEDGHRAWSSPIYLSRCQTLRA